MRSSRTLFPLVLVTAVALAGCFNPFRPEVSTERTTQSSGVAPRPTSSRNVMKLFKWCWEHQNITYYEQLFTDDFRFQFAEADTQGNQGRDYLTRGEEIDIERHMFIGGGATGEPPANGITLDYGSPLIPDADTRPGKIEPWHVMFQVDVDITIKTDAQVYRIRSKAVFFVVKMDSAKVEIVQHDLHVPYDPKRWFIERYEELGPATIVYSDPRRLEERARPATTWERVSRAVPSASGSAAAPETSDLSVSWGWIKGRYR